MKKTLLLAVSALFVGLTAQAQEPVFPRSQAEDTKGYMSEAYWKLWNAEEQARIDADIEKYRKADGELVLENMGRKRDVKIEQVEHEFIFGAHIFNFNQLGKKEWNDRSSTVLPCLSIGRSSSWSRANHVLQPSIVILRSSGTTARILTLSYTGVVLRPTRS